MSSLSAMGGKKSSSYSSSVACDDADGRDGCSSLLGSSAWLLPLTSTKPDEGRINVQLMNATTARNGNLGRAALSPFVMVPIGD